MKEAKKPEDDAGQPRNVAASELEIRFVRDSEVMIEVDNVSLEVAIKSLEALKREAPIKVIPQVYIGDDSLETPLVIRSWRRFLILSGKALYADMSELLSRIRQARAASIKQPPGSRLLTLSDFFCSPKTMKLTVNPLIADWRTEYFDALKGGRDWKARWISVLYYSAFGKSLALDKVLGLIKAVSSAFSGG